MIIDTKEKVITIYNISKWRNIMIKKRTKIKIESPKMLIIGCIIKIIRRKIFKFKNKRNKITE